MSAPPLGYIAQLQDPSGPLPSTAPAFALALTQGAGKGIATVRNPVPVLNSKAFVWANIGSAPLDLYLKCMALRIFNSGNGGYLATLQSVLGADSAGPLGWNGSPMCGSVNYLKWNAYGTMYFFPDAPDVIAAAKLGWSAGALPAIGPDGFNWGIIFAPYQTLWNTGGAAFLAAFNALRSPGTTYQYVGHGFGGSVAHLFGRYTAASYGFAPSLVTRIGSGPVGGRSYNTGNKFPATVNVTNANETFGYWPIGDLSTWNTAGAGPMQGWQQPTGRSVSFVAGKYYAGANTNSSPFFWSAENAVAIARGVATNPTPAAHALGTYAALLWAQLTPAQKAYAFVYDLHVMEGALTVAGF